MITCSKKRIVNSIFTNFIWFFAKYNIDARRSATKKLRWFIIQLTISYHSLFIYFIEVYAFFFSLQNLFFSSFLIFICCPTICTSSIKTPKTTEDNDDVSSTFSKLHFLNLRKNVTLVLKFISSL